MYCSVLMFREITGIPDEDLSDAEAYNFIEIATRRMIRDLTVRVEEEVYVDSDFNFYTTYYPIADRDGDREVTTSDIEVYGEYKGVRTSLNVTSIIPETGKVTLESFDTSAYSKVIAIYNYRTFEYDWRLIEVACAYLAGYLFACKHYLLLPDTIALGTTRYRYATKPFEHYLNLYYDTLRKIRSIPISKETEDMIKLIREGMEEYEI